MTPITALENLVAARKNFDNLPTSKFIRQAANFASDHAPQLLEEINYMKRKNKVLEQQRDRAYIERPPEGYALVPIERAKRLEEALKIIMEHSSSRASVNTARAALGETP